MGPTRRRPIGVTLTTALLYLYGIATLAAGVALVWWRNESIAQLPVLLARVDDTLPFADRFQDWQYVAVAGVLLALIGVLVMVCAGFLSVGSRVAYVVLLVLSSVLVAAAVVMLGHVSDDLLKWAADALLVVSGFVVVVLLLLLAGRRSRGFLAGR